MDERIAPATEKARGPVVAGSVWMWYGDEYTLTVPGVDPPGREATSATGTGYFTDKMLARALWVRGPTGEREATRKGTPGG